MIARLPFSMNRRVVLIGASVLILITVLIGTFLTSVYIAKSESPIIAKLAAWTSLPAARVGKMSVPYSEYLKHVEAQRVFLSGPAAAAEGSTGEITDRERAMALDRAIRIAVIEEAADKAKIVVTPLDVERAYDGLVARAGTSTSPGELQAFLRDQFGWDEPDFKQEVVRPALIEDTLRNRNLLETKDAAAFDAQLEDRLKKPDVVKYLKFQ